MTRWQAALLHLALSVPFGIAVHLGSEFAGLGRDADELAFSPLHAYLGVIALLALGTFCAGAGVFNPARERRRRIALMVGALPFGGRGPGFLCLSAVVQFSFFAVTQSGEGCPLCKGDVFVGIFAALVASVFGSIVLAELRRRVVRALAAAGIAIDRSRQNHAARPRPRQTIPAYAAIFSTFAVHLGERPPPILLRA